ncbi:hypothetical protein AX17_003693 [Amanita inopinata Kibby_2008]|nr:hypothetical protein AX17_003693 [Amanita inopinata Kibby_2008]
MIYLFATMIICFCLITFHLVVDLIRAFAAFTANMNRVGSPEAYYANVNTKLNLMKNSTVICTTLIADALLIYRTLIVWGRNFWILVLPIPLYCCDIATSIWFTWSIKEAEEGNSVLISSALQRSKYFFAATLAVNLVCTLLIAYRIWIIQKAVAGYARGQRRARNALSIVLESAAIYTAALVCLIITSCADNSAVFFFLNSMPPLIGSVFTIVVLRSSSDNDCYNTNTHTNNTNNNNTRASSIAFRSDRQRSIIISSGSNDRISMKPIASATDGVRVHLERIVHHDDRASDIMGDTEHEAVYGNVNKALP